MDDFDYRNMLFDNFKVRTARDLTDEELRQFADGLARSLPENKRRPHPGRPKNMETERGPLLGKIEALLAEANRTWAYADGCARNMYRVEKTEWCDPSQLHGIVAALMKDAKRHGRPTR